MRQKIYVHPIKVNLDRMTADALEGVHDESGWNRNQIIRIGLQMFISEYGRLGIGKGLYKLRTRPSPNCIPGGLR